MKLFPINTFGRCLMLAPVAVRAGVSRCSSSNGKTKLSGKFTAFSLLLLMAMPVQARNLEYFMKVKPLPGGQEFEVLNHPGAGATLFWCGAGTYAMRKLGLGTMDQIYLVQGRAPSVTTPGTNAVTFTVDSKHPVVGTYQHTGWGVSAKDPGYNMSVGSARQYCFEKMS